MKVSHKGLSAPTVEGEGLTVFLYIAVRQTVSSLD